MASFVGIERRYSDKSVNAGFLTEIAECVISLYSHSHALQSSFFPSKKIENIRFETFPLRISQIHPEKYLGPVLGFGPARARVNSENSISRIILLKKECLELCPFKVFFE